MYKRKFETNVLFFTRALSYFENEENAVYHLSHSHNANAYNQQLLKSAIYESCECATKFQKHFLYNFTYYLHCLKTFNYVVRFSLCVFFSYLRQMLLCHSCGFRVSSTEHYFSPISVSGNDNNNDMTNTTI